MTKETLIAIINEIDSKNAEYIINECHVADEFRMINRFEAKGNEDRANEIVDMIIRNLKEWIAEYDSRKLTPANAKVGDGATIRLYSDAHAGTIVKVTKCSITIRRDKATLDPNFKPEWIAGGFAGHCINQDEQSYTYEPDENGEEYTIRWSKKYNSFGQAGNIRATKGRHEFYDYNF